MSRSHIHASKVVGVCVCTSQKDYTQYDLEVKLDPSQEDLCIYEIFVLLSLSYLHMVCDGDWPLI